MRHRWTLAATALLGAATPLLGQTSSALPTVRLSGYLQARETYQDEIGLTSTNQSRSSHCGRHGAGRPLLADPR